MLICDLAGDYRLVPVPEQGARWRRLLWSGGRNGGESRDGEHPPASLAPEGLTSGSVALKGWEAVLYLRSPIS